MPLLLSLWLLLLLCSCCVSVVQAETRTEEFANFKISPTKLSSPPLYGKVTGSGYVDVAALNLFVTRPQNHTVFVDVAIAIIPDEYENILLDEGEEGLLLTAGIGAEGTRDGIYYGCCTDDAIAAGACSIDDNNNNNNGGNGEFYDEKDRIIVRNWKNVRLSTFEIFPNSLDYNGTIAMAGVRGFEVTTHTAIVFGNCDSLQGQYEMVLVQGTVIWLSYIAGNSLPLVLVLGIAHLSLMLWFRRLMQTNESTRIRIEEWIYATTVLAFVSTVLLAIRYAVESSSDREMYGVRFLSDIADAVKGVVSRCLYVMMALGWGVTKPSLRLSTRITIQTIGGVWIIARTFDDFYAKLYFTPLEPPAIMTSIMLYIPPLANFFIFFWIPVALCRTMSELAANQEHRKLQRFRWMLRIFFLAIVLTILEIFLFFWDMIKDGGREYDAMSIVEGNNIIYFLILLCIAMLWRPNPEAPEYGYVLLGEDEEDNDLHFNNNDMELVERDESNDLEEIRVETIQKKDRID